MSESKTPAMDTTAAAGLLPETEAVNETIQSDAPEDGGASRTVDRRSSVPTDSVRILLKKCFTTLLEIFTFIESKLFLNQLFIRIIQN